MLLQPRGQRLGITAEEHVDNPVGLAVDQHSAVVMTALDREVIHPKHRNVTDRRVGQSADQPEQAVAAGGHAQRRRQPGTGPAGQRESDRRQHPPETFADA